jgi:hypothetical protein
MNKLLTIISIIVTSFTCFAQDDAETPKQQKIYTVIVDGNMLKCIDAQGSVLGSLSNVGNVVQGPQVNGNQCSVICEDEQFGRALYIYELPSFSRISFQQLR